MPYELHIDQTHVASFATLDEALTRARKAVRERPDCETEILDSETRRPVEPASSRHWRDELSNKVGY